MNKLMERCAKLEAEKKKFKESVAFCERTLRNVERGKTEAETSLVVAR